MSTKFPVFNIEAVKAVMTDLEYQFIPLLFKSNGELRHSKIKFNPAIRTKELEKRVYGIDSETGKEIASTFNVYRYVNPEDELKAHSAYIWRFICFDCIAEQPHSCIPCNVDFYIVGTSKEQEYTKKQLKDLENRIVNTLPVEQHKNVLRWGRALGLI